MLGSGRTMLLLVNTLALFDYTKLTGYILELPVSLRISCISIRKAFMK